MIINSKNIRLLFVLLVFSFSLTACAGKQEASHVLSPLPINTDGTEKEDKGKETTIVREISYADNSENQYVEVHTKFNRSLKAKASDPKELALLLEMESVQDKEDTAVMRMRPKAIEEAAQLVAFQTAMEWRYKQLLEETENHSVAMDKAFNFAPLLMTHDEALIMPPVLTKAEASMHLESDETLTTAKTTYELLEPAKYISIIPHWRIFLMADDFPKAEKPNPTLLPQNSKERSIWREAVRKAWEQGIQEADMLYADNVARMTRKYRGIMLYHLLTAQHFLTRVNAASADMGLHISDEGKKLHIGQKVYRITAPSRFMTNQSGEE